MLIALVHQEVDPAGNHAEQDTLIQAESIEQALRSLGHESLRISASLNLEKLREDLVRLAGRSDVVLFNLVESLGGRDCLMHLAPELYEAMGFKYTGARSDAIRRTNLKHRAKQEMLQAGIPTATWYGPSFTSDDARSFRPGTYIFKAATEHASIGMMDDAVKEVKSFDALVQHVKELEAAIERPAMAEQFIDGRELNLSVIATSAGREVLPPAEIDFSTLPSGKPRIVGYAAKWLEESPEYENTPRTFQFAESDGLMLERAKSIALQCWDHFGLSGYARVDFRVDRDGNPWVLEINANPCATEYGGFIAACSQGGLDYQQVIARLLETAS